MASETRTQDAAIRATLQSIPDVDRVRGDETEGYWLFCSAHAPHARILNEARRIVEEHGLDPESSVEVVVPVEHLERRVRFDRLERIQEANQSVRVRVYLEWNGEAHAGEAVGERGETLELRTAAAAAVAAVENVTGERLALRLVGVKQVRAFDAELVVVSLFGTATRQRLLGVVLAGTDPHRATAVAVLSSLNRVLGNYLQRRT